MKQLKEKNGNKDFNHYSPANYFAKNIANITLSDDTLDNFEALFKAINKLFWYLEDWYDFDTKNHINRYNS